MLRLFVCPFILVVSLLPTAYGAEIQELSKLEEPLKETLFELLKPFQNVAGERLKLYYEPKRENEFGILDQEGIPLIHATQKDGELDGELFFLKDDGAPHLILNFKKGVLHGEMTLFWGKIPARTLYQAHYVNGHPVWERFYEFDPNSGTGLLTAIVSYRVTKEKKLELTYEFLPRKEDRRKYLKWGQISFQNMGHFPVLTLETPDVQSRMATVSLETEKEEFKEKLVLDPELYDPKIWSQNTSIHLTPSLRTQIHYQYPAIFAIKYREGFQVFQEARAIISKVREENRAPVELAKEEIRKFKLELALADQETREKIQAKIEYNEVKLNALASRENAKILIELNQAGLSLRTVARFAKLFQSLEKNHRLSIEKHPLPMLQSFISVHASSLISDD